MDFPPEGFIRRRPAIFDLDTVSRLFLVHWLTPAPLHHPMGSRFVLRDGMLSDLARDRRSNARRSDKSDLRGSLPPSRRSGAAVHRFAAACAAPHPGHEMARSFYSMAGGAWLTSYGRFPEAARNCRSSKKGRPRPAGQSRPPVAKL